MTSRARSVLVAALALLALTTGCGRQDDPAPTGSAPSRSPSSTAPEAADPRTGQDYCETVRLLAAYSRTDYGLDQKTASVDPVRFGQRLDVVAATFARLARQSDTASSRDAWQRLATAADRARRTYRAGGQQLTSQVVLRDLSVLSAAMTHQLAPATANLRERCDLDPGLFGLGGA
ncbi:hypothetical protein [Nocardioides sp. LML1-1-1.1]|uniref:hypothetical protein n=1 Tax=Nocardioides sp. LML1-1-1.1 TaxID=3135248 RepID=UPI003418A0F0